MRNLSPYKRPAPVPPPLDENSFDEVLLGVPGKIIAKGHAVIEIDKGILMSVIYIRPEWVKVVPGIETKDYEFRGEWTSKKHSMQFTHPLIQHDFIWNREVYPGYSLDEINKIAYAMKKALWHYKRNSQNAKDEK